MTTDIATTDKMNTDFALDEIVVGRTVVSGRSTSGRTVRGTVTRVVPGVCIHVVGGAQPSLLWGDFAIVGQVDEAATAAAADPMAPIPLRRTDSGADYGMPGYPDCEFWERHGIEPVFVATADMYTGGAGSPSELRELLEENRPEEEDSAVGRAWRRQIAQVKEQLRTPPASPKAQPVCPPAPARPAPMRPPPIVIPTIDDHKGRGILAGDWIKPDPVMTRQETRRYVVAETERWLTGRICSHAKEIAIADPDPAVLDALVAEGKWPAARLYLVYRGFQRGDVGDIELPLCTDGILQIVGDWAAKVCAAHLNGYEAGNPLAKLAVGFVTTDLLPGNPPKVIADFWDHSPFNALRNAPPLPDTDTEQSDTDTEDEDVDERGGLLGVRPSLDDQLEEIGEAAGEFMGTQYRLTLYGWQWSAMFGVVIAYLWVVALMLGRR